MGKSSASIWLIYALTLSINLFTHSATAATPPSKNTEAVVLATGINLKDLDPAVRPQDNFFEYVNGLWLKKTKIPADKVSIGSFYSMEDETNKEVKGIVEQLLSETSPIPGASPDIVGTGNEQKIADLYRSYMNTKLRNNLGIGPIAPQLQQIDDITNVRQLIEYFASAQINGISVPWSFYIEEDAKDSNHYLSILEQSGLSLPNRDYYLGQSAHFKDLRHEFTQHVEKVFALARIPFSQGDAQKLLELETRLAKIQWDAARSRDVSQTYHIYRSHQLSALAPKIDWSEYFSKIGLGTQARVNVEQPSYFEHLSNIIANTDLNTWQDYLRWHLLMDSSPYLTTALDEEHFHFFDQKINGQQRQKAPWQRAISLENSWLGEAIGQIYIKNHDSVETKKEIEALVEQLKQAYSQSIDELDWMTPATKAAAQQKLKLLTIKIAYPDKWRSYEGLVINADSLHGNFIRHNQFEHAYDLARLEKPVQKWQWVINPQTVNAYYNPSGNEIVFPLAVLSPPFFDINKDAASNYGGIGAIIGHEMGHALDDQGAQYDAHGNLYNWWSAEDLQAFKQRTELLIKQYDNYQLFDGLHVNGTLTKGENIGDLSGITIAYRAYKNSLKGKTEPVIDGLSADERFFISFASIWRIKTTEETQRKWLSTDGHSPNQFRTNGPLSNMPEFYRTYKVKPGDGMYLSPKDRVKIW